MKKMQPAPMQSRLTAHGSGERRSIVAMAGSHAAIQAVFIDGRPCLRPNQESPVIALDDVRAVDEVLNGDASAFAAIVHRWQGPLVNLAYRFCRDRSRSEDMAQEAFVKAFRKLSTWRREAAFSTWLFALAINVYRSEMRRGPPAPLTLQETAEPVDPQQLEVDADEAEQARLLRCSIHTLPAKYRDALVLFYFHDLDIAQAARSLGVPEGTVKARLSRGRDMLSRKLAASLGKSLSGDDR